MTTSNTPLQTMTWNVGESFSKNWKLYNLQHGSLKCNVICRWFYYFVFLLPMCEQFSPPLIIISLTRDHIPQIIIRPLFCGSLLQKWHQTLMLLPWGGELLYCSNQDKNYTKCLWFLVFHSKPTLLSLIAVRSVGYHFYERLPPINLPLIFHMKVMSLLMVTEV